MVGLQNLFVDKLAPRMCIELVVEVELVPCRLLVRIGLTKEASTIWELVLDFGESFLHLFAVCVNDGLQGTTFWSLIYNFSERIKTDLFVVNLENYGLLAGRVELFWAFLFNLLILDNGLI